MDFYILINNAKQGPFPMEELADRNITPNTMVWAVGFSNWKQAKDVSELSEILSNLPPIPPEARSMPKTWLVESILVTCLCCLPFGIMGILNSTKIEASYQNGEYEQALYLSKQAKKWTLWGFCIALTTIVLYIITLFITIIVSGNF